MSLKLKIKTLLLLAPIYASKFQIPTPHEAAGHEGDDFRVGVGVVDVVVLDDVGLVGALDTFSVDTEDVLEAEEDERSQEDQNASNLMRIQVNKTISNQMS